MKDVTLEIIRAWKHNFPAIDVELELCRIELWLAKHPTRAAKMRMHLRFCETWFKRAQVNARSKFIIVPKEGLTERELIAMGTEKGIFAHPGESRQDFERRVRQFR